MRIGLIADTHDNLPKIEKAIKVFNTKRVSLVLHAGDYIAPFSLSLFKKLKCEYLGVFGNNDGEREGLLKVSEGRIKEAPLIIERDSRKIVLIHELGKLDLKNTNCNLVIFGHTHKSKIRKNNSVLFINPGECGGWLTKRSTVGILDLDSLSIDILKI